MIWICFKTVTDRHIVNFHCPSIPLYVHLMHLSQIWYAPTLNGAWFIYIYRQACLYIPKTINISADLHFPSSDFHRTSHVNLYKLQEVTYWRYGSCPTKVNVTVAKKQIEYQDFLTSLLMFSFLHQIFTKLCVLLLIGASHVLNTSYV